MGQNPNWESGSVSFHDEGDESGDEKGYFEHHAGGLSIAGTEHVTE